MKVTETQSSTGQIPAAERFALRTMEARIEWWVESARRAAAEGVERVEARRFAA